jgi:hypothetical protein
MKDSSKSDLTHREALLIELTYYLSKGDHSASGLDLKAVFDVLTLPIKSKDGNNAVHCLSTEGREFLNELLSYLDESYSQK